MSEIKKEKISPINYNLGNMNGNVITCLTIDEVDGFNIIDIHTFCRVCNVHIINRNICRSNSCKFCLKKKYFLKIKIIILLNNI